MNNENQEFEAKSVSEPIQFRGYSGFNKSTPVYVSFKGVIIDISAHQGSFDEKSHLNSMSDILDLRHEKNISKIFQPFLTDI